MSSGCILWLLLAMQPASPPPQVSELHDSEPPPTTTSLERLGIEVASADGNNSFHLWFRGQFRYSYPFDDAPTTAEGFTAPPVSSFDIRRARLKLGGNAYRPWLQYYFEFDFPSTRLLDLRFTVSKIPWFQVRVGQWKVNYNRERVDSSGRQQFVERSIVNRVFTLDRQPGILIAGHVLRGKPLADSWYMFGVFNGNGANQSNDDGSMMLMGRYQWNFLGRELKAAQSDVEFHEKPAGTLAFAGVKNRSPFTRFSGAGGGELVGFEPGAPGQYDIRQFVEETAFKYRGFSFQHEFHWKEIEDHVHATTTDLRGMYAQAGYLPWAHSSGHALKPLEFALRYAFVDPDISMADDLRTELTVGANWFFAGHDNKITIDLSRLRLAQVQSELAEYRIRAQWDISF